MFIGIQYGLMSTAVSLGVPRLVSLLVTPNKIPVYIDLITGAVDSVFSSITYVFPIIYSLVLPYLFWNSLYKNGSFNQTSQSYFLKFLFSDTYIFTITLTMTLFLFLNKNWHSPCFLDLGNLNSNTKFWNNLFDEILSSEGTCSISSLRNSFHKYLATMPFTQQQLQIKGSAYLWGVIYNIILTVI